MDRCEYCQEIVLDSEVCQCKGKQLEAHAAELKHALKVCRADADRALLSGTHGDYQGALLAIRLTAGNAIA